MSGMRKVICFLTVVMLAVFALPASAGTKDFKIAVPAGPLAAGAQSLSVTFTNLSSSNPNSLELDVQTGPLVITSATVPGGINGNVINAGKSVQFTNLSPVKNSITVTVNATVSVSCASAPVKWFAHMWTGSPTSPSQVFNLTNGTGTQIPPAPYPFTTVSSASCTLGFIKQPAGALAGQTITSVGSDPTGAPVQVGAFIGATQDTTFNGPVSLTIKSGTGTAGASLSGSGPINAVSGAATFPSLSINTIGTDYQLTASSGTYTPVDSTKFSIFAGILGCTDGTVGATGTNNYDSSLGPNDPTFDPNPDVTYVGTKGWGLRRGPNIDGNACVLVDYTCTFEAADKVAKCVSDKSTGQKVAFKYTVLWPAVAVDSNGWKDFHPNLSWGISNPVLNTDDYVPALACIDDGVNFATLTPAQLLALLPTIPNVAPFAGNPHTQYLYGIDPDTGQLRKAKMCIAQHGFTSVGPDGSGNALVQYWDKVIDESDGHVGGP